MAAFDVELIAILVKLKQPCLDTVEHPLNCSNLPTGKCFQKKSEMIPSWPFLAQLGDRESV